MKTHGSYREGEERHCRDRQKEEIEIVTYIEDEGQSEKIDDYRERQRQVENDRFTFLPTARECQQYRCKQKHR